MKPTTILFAITLVLAQPAAADHEPEPAWRYLNHAETVHGHVLPAGTRVRPDAAGNPDIAFLGEDTLLEGHLCRGGDGHGYMTGFHSNGRLRLCWLREAETVQGVPCRRATFLNDLIGPSVGVTFHPDGSLAGCKLDQDFTLDGVTYDGGSRIEFDRQGNVR